ncbi:MAG: hypothetical protein ACREQY_16955 [Candidatus Binatia bacterium]
MISAEALVAGAIRAALEVNNDPDLLGWAVAWLSGADRSAASAERQARRADTLLGGNVPDEQELSRLIEAGMTLEEMRSRFRPFDEPADEADEVAVLRLQAASAATEAVRLFAVPEPLTKDRDFEFLYTTAAECAVKVRKAGGATNAETWKLLRSRGPRGRSSLAYGCARDVGALGR